MTAPAPAIRLPDMEPALRVVPMPADANQHGDIFGGWVMSQVDIAGSIPASRRARGRVATVAVEVYAQRNPTDVICVKVTEANLTYVAVAPDRRPRVLPTE